MRELEIDQLRNYNGGGFWTGMACDLGISLTVGAIIGTGGAAAIIGAAAFGGFANGACIFGKVVKRYEGYDF